ncbi:hypothetical protein CHU98_g10800 [Xylaria longipes]|nr:hypothetical protein CHU98_g10800 [Xylaria longipes]
MHQPNPATRDWAREVGESSRSWVWRWLTRVEEMRPLGLGGDPEAYQQSIPPFTYPIDSSPETTISSTSSISSITTYVATFYGDSFYSPSDLIDLRSSSTLLSYAASSINYSQEDSIPTLDLNQQAQDNPQDNPLEAQHSDSD